MVQLVCDRPQDVEVGDGEVTSIIPNWKAFFFAIDGLVDEWNGKDTVFLKRPTEYLAKIQKETREGQRKEERTNLL